MKIIDISRPIGKGEAVYPGNTAPILTRLKIFSRDGSNLGAVSMGLHTASHLDAPLHYVRKGRSIDQILPEKCIGWCRIIDCTKTKTEISGKEIARAKPKAGEIILLKTRNSAVNPKKFDPKFVHISEQAAKVLISAKVKAVGIDGPSIRKFRLKPDIVHPMLLKAGILVYEGLQFKGINAGRYFFVGLPLKLKEAEASPVRAVLIKT
jgi:arylformamidase